MTAGGNVRLTVVRDQAAFDFGADDRKPPATRAECQGHAGACARTSCNHNTTFEYEVPGNPNGRGTHNGPRRIVRDASDTPVVNPQHPAVSCVLDELDANGGEPLELAETAYVMGTGERRVQQLADRGLDKAYVARRFIEMVETWAEAELYPRGGDLEHVWGVLFDDEGVQMRREHDGDRVIVSVVIDVAHLQRPKPKVETAPKDAERPHAVDGRALRGLRVKAGYELRDVMLALGGETTVVALANVERGVVACKPEMRSRLEALYAKGKGIDGGR